MRYKNKSNTKAECPVYIKGHRCPVMDKRCEYIENVGSCPGYQEHFMPDEERERIKGNGLAMIVAGLGLKKLKDNGKRK